MKFSLLRKGPSYNTRILGEMYKVVVDGQLWDERNHTIQLHEAIATKYFYLGSKDKEMGIYGIWTVNNELIVYNHWLVVASSIIT